MDTLKELMSVGGRVGLGVLSSTSKKTKVLKDGHKVTFSFPDRNQATSCDDDVILPIMANAEVVKFSATKEGTGNSISQQITGVVAAARAGHEDSITKLRQIATKTATTSTPATVES
jgi:hypothetical protein